MPLCSETSVPDEERVLVCKLDEPHTNSPARRFQLFGLMCPEELKHYEVSRHTCPHLSHLSFDLTFPSTQTTAPSQAFLVGMLTFLRAWV